MLKNTILKSNSLLKETKLSYTSTRKIIVLKDIGELIKDDITKVKSGLKRKT
jgi:hypothetical protein